MNGKDEQTAIEGWAGNSSDVGVDRRTILTLVATTLSTAGVVGTVSRSVTAETSGYGANRFGAGSYGEPSTDDGSSV